MYSWEPTLFEFLEIASVIRLLPECWSEESAVLIECQRLKRMLDVTSDFGVYEGEFFDVLLVPVNWDTQCTSISYQSLTSV
jgi:hypothetical protein